MSIGSWLNWPRTATVLAVSYLVPWAWENVKGIQIRSRALTRRRRGMTRRRNNNNDNRGNDDCGARPADQGPVVPASVALRNMLDNTPDRIVVNEGDVCSICLEAFTTEVIAVGSSPQDHHTCHRVPYSQCSPPYVIFIVFSSPTSTRTVDRLLPMDCETYNRQSAPCAVVRRTVVILDALICSYVHCSYRLLLQAICCTKSVQRVW